jgi:hypothetical protein
MSIPLVLIEGQTAKRYVDGKPTHKAESEYALTAEEVEAFRVAPEEIPTNDEAA